MRAVTGDEFLDIGHAAGEQFARLCHHRFADVFGRKRTDDSTPIFERAVPSP